MLTVEPRLARAWLERWESQQEHYVADRESRFGAIMEVLGHTLTDTNQPVVLDLGCGPGSLSARLAERLPTAEIIGVDVDPLLLALAAGAHEGVARFVETDLRTPGWSWSLRLNRTVEAAVSTTALHYLPRAEVAALYRELAGLLRPGGVFINADNLYDPQPAIAELAAVLRRRRVRDGENWESWWRAVREEPALAPLVAERERRLGRHGGDHPMSFDDHAALLRQAGFGQVGTVWQVGDDVVLVAVR